MIWNMRLARERILYNKKQYIFIVLQVLLGIAILYSSICADISVNRQSETYTQTVANQLMTVTGYSDEIEREALAISPEDFAYIQENIQPQGSKIVYTIETGMYVEQNDQKNRIQVLFVSEDFYDVIMDVRDLNPSEHYLGSEASNRLQEGHFEVDSYNEYAYQEQTGELFGVPLGDYRVLSAQQNGQTARSYQMNTFGNNNDLSFSNTIFLPIEEFSQYQSSIIGTAYLYVSTDNENTDQIQTFLNEIVQYLNQEHPSFRYRYTDDLQYLQDANTGVIRNVQLIRVVAGLLLVIVAFGFLGLFMLLAKKRQRSFAIAIMCGATIRQIIAELFIEVMTLMFAGTCLGIVIGGFALPLFSIPLYTVYNSVWAILICFGLTLCISAVVTLIISQSIKKLTPVNVLRQL